MRPIMLNKQIVGELSEKFSAEWQMTASHQFRQFDELHTNSLYNWYLMEAGYAYVPGNKKRVSLYMMSDDNAPRLIRELNEWVADGAKSICLNDDLKTQRIVNQVNAVLVQWLEQKMPSKSAFEKE